MKVQVREELERRKGVKLCVCVCLRIARHCNDDDDSESAQLSSAQLLDWPSRIFLSLVCLFLLLLLLSHSFIGQAWRAILPRIVNGEMTQQQQRRQ